MTGPAISVQAEGAQAMPGDPAQITLPSGLVATLQDVIWNTPGPAGLTLRFRFVVQGLSDPGLATDDMAWLCQEYAVPRLSDLGPKPAQIIISLSDRALRFGDSAPEATQFFEAYAVQDGTCTVEFF
jgi:hypothetical protein